MCVLHGGRVCALRVRGKPLRTVTSTFRMCKSERGMRGIPGPGELTSPGIGSAAFFFPFLPFPFLPMVLPALQWEAAWRSDGLTNCELLDSR